MSPVPKTHHDGPYRRRLALWSKLALFAVVVNCLLTGCAALTNPSVNAIPVRKLPTELLSNPRRENLQTIPLSLLGQDTPEQYVLGPGDVLGLFISGILPFTDPDQPQPQPPVYFPSQIDPLGTGLPPTLGYPISIRQDGTINLPLVDPIRVAGLTVVAATEEIRKTYLDMGLLRPGREAIFLDVMQPRRFRVWLFRQELGGFAAGGRGDIATSNVKLGTGHVIDLRAYENDLLNALASTGGMPGLDAYDSIFIFRAGGSNAAVRQRLESIKPTEDPSSLAGLDVEIVHIPTRWPPGKPVPFQPEDVILHEGDVVFMEARNKDVFYAGGLLPSGEYRLPRDYDLDVLEAVAQIRGALFNGAFGGNNLNGLLLLPGLGNASPSALTVIRRTPNGATVPIRVDLNRAVRDSRERIIVQPGDVLILQETMGEAVARYASNVFNLTIFGKIIQRGSADGIATLAVP